MEANRSNSQPRPAAPQRSLALRRKRHTLLRECKSRQCPNKDTTVYNARVTYNANYSEQICMCTFEWDELSGVTRVISSELESLLWGTKWYATKIDCRRYYRNSNSSDIRVRRARLERKATLETRAIWRCGGREELTRSLCRNCR